ncbi:MAG: hypothetical protein V2J55_20865 [Candidatus Competibacteraceae bacterium]|jgi:hypothetical protein|nr:hypothetical protein [Candidatus Competibacteraceae bacterium]
MIEHRCSKRQEIALAASLYHQGRYWAGGIILNANQHGLFVATDVAAPKHAFLEVIFSVPSEQGENHHRFFAMVTHADECGMGLYTDVLIPESRRGLSALLKYSKESDLCLDVNP